MDGPLILASQSPRRRALLDLLAVPFAVDAADIDETPLPDELPAALVVRLSRTKAEVVAGRYRESPVLAADTVVALDNDLLGKPANAAEAEQMLRVLRDRAHQVYTAVSLAYRGAIRSKLSASTVWMRNYADDEIRAYVATGDPLDKAGAYAIQHVGFAPVAHWEGCYAAVMGLPLGIVAELLAGAGIAAQEDIAAACENLGEHLCCHYSSSGARDESSESIGELPG